MKTLCSTYIQPGLRSALVSYFYVTTFRYNNVANVTVGFNVDVSNVKLRTVNVC